VELAIGLAKNFIVIRFLTLKKDLYQIEWQKNNLQK
jgi:hypothetical protein